MIVSPSGAIYWQILNDQIGFKPRRGDTVNKYLRRKAVYDWRCDTNRGGGTLQITVHSHSCCSPCKRCEVYILLEEITEVRRFLKAQAVTDLGYVPIRMAQ